MKKNGFLVLFCLVMLTACGSGSGENNNSAMKATENSSKDKLDQSGCNGSATPFGGGSGRKNDPFLICSVAQLEAMAGSGSANYFALTSDLDMTHEKHQCLGVAITGVFDGREHTIRNFTVNLEMNQENGFLFGQLFTTNELVAEIKNLNLESFQIKTNSPGGTAALVGTNGGRITNVHVTGNISGKDMVGGIVSHNFGIIQDSSFTGMLQGQSEVGGIAGAAATDSITRCHVSGQITGESSVGGIAGTADRQAGIFDNQVEAQVSGKINFGQEVGKRSN